MEKELEQFRQEVERLRAGRQRGSLPYPEVETIVGERGLSIAGSARKRGYAATAE